MPLFICTYCRIKTLFMQTSTCPEKLLQTTYLTLINLLSKWINFEFDLSSDISAWIEALGPGNPFELTGISSYPISSYPK